MFKYNPVEQTKKRASVWPYLVIIIGVLQFILFSYILFLLTYVISNEKYSAAGAAFEAVTAFGPLFILASVNCFGVPYYIKSNKPKGFKLILSRLSFAISVAVEIFAFWLLLKITVLW